MKKYRYRLDFNTKFLFFFKLFESLKLVFITMVAILIMSAKLTSLDLLKIEVF